MPNVTTLKKKVKPEDMLSTADFAGLPFIDLHYSGGGSDKVYHAAIRNEGGDNYTVQFAYGRRGSSLTYGAKTPAPVPLSKATATYDKLVAEKIGKGYRESPGVSGNVFGNASPSHTQTAHLTQKEASGVLPQLCNECTEEEVEALIKDPAWGAQEKLDGKRKLIRCGSEIQGINKKGEVVPLPPEISRAVKAMGVPVLLDGEEIGNTHYTFGLLEMDGRNMRSLSYLDAYRELEKLLKKFPSKALSLVELAITAKQKRSLLNSLKTGNKEGIIFKRLAAAYSPGRPASGGDHIKFKFWSDISVIVLGRNEKRSVQIGVLPSPKATPMPIGNVSVPEKYELPVAGDIIDVRYLYANRGGCLYQPQYRGKRDDVSRAECLESRIKYKNAV